MLLDGLGAGSAETEDAVVRAKLEAVVAHDAERAELLRQAVGMGVDEGQWEAPAVKNYYPHGLPLPGFNATDGKALHEQSLQRNAFYDEVLGPRLAAETLGSAVQVAWSATGGKPSHVNAEVNKLLKADLSLVIFSFVVVLIMVSVHTSSLLVGLFGVLLIGASFPVALFFYTLVLSIPLISFVHVIGIFLIIGIACDDLFVVHDHIAHGLRTVHRAESLEDAVVAAWRRSIGAVAMTTLTNTAAFLTTVQSPVPNLYTFGVLMALLCITNFLLATAVWPALLLLHFRRRRRRRAHAPVAAPGTAPGNAPSLERWYAVGFVPFLRRGRNAAALVAACVALTVVSVWQLPHLQNTGNDVMVWPEGHIVRTYFELSWGRQYAREQVVMLQWGVAGIDRSRSSPYEEDELGEPIWDDAFALDEPEAQRAVLRACDEVPRVAALRVRDQTCVLRALDAWVRGRYRLSLPLPRHVFLRALLGFLLEEPHWLSDLSLSRLNESGLGERSLFGPDIMRLLPLSPAGMLDGTYAVDEIDLRVRHVVVSFLIDSRHSPTLYERREQYDAWHAETARLDELAPPHVAQVGCPALLGSSGA